jgi:hypothetical protein
LLFRATFFFIDKGAAITFSLKKALIGLTAIFHLADAPLNGPRHLHRLTIRLEREMQLMLVSLEMPVQYFTRVSEAFERRGRSLLPNKLDSICDVIGFAFQAPYGVFCKRRNKSIIAEVTMILDLPRLGQIDGFAPEERGTG